MGQIENFMTADRNLCPRAQRPRPDLGPPSPAALVAYLDQVIAFNYTLNGNGGSIEALDRPDYRPEWNVVGLIE